MLTATVVSLNAARRSRDSWRKGGPPTVEYLADEMDECCCVTDCTAFANFKVSKRGGYLLCCSRGAHIEIAVARFLPTHPPAERRWRQSSTLEGPHGVTPYYRRKWRKAYEEAKYAARAKKRQAAC